MFPNINRILRLNISVFKTFLCLSNILLHSRFASDCAITPLHCRILYCRFSTLLGWSNNMKCSWVHMFKQSSYTVISVRVWRKVHTRIGGIEAVKWGNLVWVQVLHPKTSPGRGLIARLLSINDTAIVWPLGCLSTDRNQSFHAWIPMCLLSALHRGYLAR